jgi:hypothetical protein
MTLKDFSYTLSILILFFSIIAEKNFLPLRSAAAEWQSRFHALLLYEIASRRASLAASAHTLAMGTVFLT